jgi:hypothetical protein
MDIFDIQLPSPIVYRYTGAYPWHILDLLLYLKSFELNHTKRIILFEGRSGQTPWCCWRSSPPILSTAWERVAEVHLLRYPNLNWTVDRSRESSRNCTTRGFLWRKGCGRNRGSGGVSITRPSQQFSLDETQLDSDATKGKGSSGKEVVALQELAQQLTTN